MPQSKIPYNNLKKILGNKCINCGSENDIQYHHIIPLSLGGNDIITNIVPLCGKCHSLIHDRKKENISELTKAGIEKARKAGKQIGRVKGSKIVTQKSIEAKKYILNNSINFNGNMSNIDIINNLKIAKNTYYKYQRELYEEIKGTKEINNV